VHAHPTGSILHIYTGSVFDPSITFYKVVEHDKNGKPLLKRLDVHPDIEEGTKLRKWTGDKSKKEVTLTYHPSKDTKTIGKRVTPVVVKKLDVEKRTYSYNREPTSSATRLKMRGSPMMHTNTRKAYKVLHE